MKHLHIELGVVFCCSIIIGASSLAKSHGSGHGLEICQADGQTSPPDGVTEAKALYVEGNKAYSAKRYEEAYKNFSKASSLGYKRADRMLKKLESLAKHMYENAYVLKMTNPERAIRYLDLTIQIVSPDNIYYLKAKRLKKRIMPDLVKNAGSDQLENKLIESVTEKKSYKLTAEQKSQVEKLKKAAGKKMKARKYSDAIDLNLQALKIDPGNCPIIVRLGICRAMSGNTKAAYKWYKKYLKKCPKAPQAPRVERLTKDYEENR